MKYKLFVFDWDGTLMDSQAHIVSSFQASINDLSLPVKTDDQVKNIIGLGMVEAINALFEDEFPGDKFNFHKDLIDRYRYHFFADHASRSELFAGATEVLAALEPLDCYLAVATGKGRNGLKRVLEETGLKRCFHSTRCADETASKPDPLMLKEIMDELDIPPQQTIMIGDTEYDLEMANNAGIDALAVNTGVHSRERLLSQQPVACINHIGEMLDWLQTIK